MNCPSCQTVNVNSSKFCSQCGLLLASGNSVLNQERSNEIPAPSARKKGGCLKWGLIVTGSIILLLILIGLFANEDESTVTNGGYDDIVYATYIRKTTSAIECYYPEFGDNNRVHPQVLEFLY